MHMICLMWSIQTTAQFAICCCSHSALSCPFSFSLSSFSMLVQCVCTFCACVHCRLSSSFGLAKIKLSMTYRLFRSVFARQCRLFSAQFHRMHMVICTFSTYATHLAMWPLCAFIVCLCTDFYVFTLKFISFLVLTSKRLFGFFFLALRAPLICAHFVCRYACYMYIFSLFRSRCHRSMCQENVNSVFGFLFFIRPFCLMHTHLWILNLVSLKVIWLGFRLKSI